MKFRVGNIIKIWDGARFKPAKELKPVMAYPEFTEPTYEYLEEISQNFILPNVDKLPPKFSIVLLKLVTSSCDVEAATTAFTLAIWAAFITVADAYVLPPL